MSDTIWLPFINTLSCIFRQRFKSMSKLKELYQFIINSGVNPEYGDRQSSKIQLTNKFAFIFGGMGFMQIPPFYLASKSFEIVISSLLIGSLFFVGVLLNAKQLHIWAKVFFCVTVSGAATYFSGVMGTSDIGQMLCFVLISVPVMVFIEGEETYRNISFLFPIAAFFTLELYDFNVLPIADTSQVYMRSAIILVVFTLAISTVRSFASEVQGLLKDAQELLKQSQQQNEELQSSQEELQQNQEELLSVNNQLEVYKNQLEIKVEERTRQFERAKVLAEKANEAKTLFLANMSHEIRSPLNAIVGFSQLLHVKSKRMALDTEFLRFLENIKISGNNLSELINNILDLSKIEAGKMGVSIETINVKQLFQGIYHINKGRAVERELNFSYDFDYRLPEFIESDRTKLNQILMNLTTNAIKFTEIGKRVELQARLENNRIVFNIVDEGPGITQQNQARIFAPFEQGDNTLTRKYGGTGLGLAITKQMVEMLEGSITVQSQLNRGSVFSVSLPLIEGKDAPKTQQQFDLNAITFSKNNTVLVVEDNELNQKMMQGLFDELGLTMHLAQNGVEGVTMAKTLKPDLILMDLHMPELDGIQATKQIRDIEGFEELPIVAVSADAFTEQQRRALAIGINEYVTKPIDFNKLLPIFVKYLRQQEDSIRKKPNKLELEAADIKILKALAQQLLHLPIFNSEELLDIIQQMKPIAQGHEAFDEWFAQLEDAIFSVDEEQLKTQVDQFPQ